MSVITTEEALTGTKPWTARTAVPQQSTEEGDGVVDAASKGDVSALTTLLENGARINDTDKEGYAALQVAVKKGHYETVEYLLQSDANVNQRDSDGFSALHEAALLGHEDIARLLLKWGADKRIVSGEGTTALEIAVRHGHGVIASEDDVATTGHDDPPTADSASLCWRYCLHIAYFGTGFVGWQRQIEANNAGQGSVQDAVERAVTKAVDAPRRVNVTSCSRTDAGTHALSQYGTIKLTHDPRLSTCEFQERVNDLLPVGVRVLKIEQLPASLKPSRFRSKYKKYVYYIQQGHRPDLDLGKYSWFLGRRLDIERLRDALSLIVGTHDFRPFSQGMQKAEFADRSSVRTIVSARVHVKRNVVFSLDPFECGTGETVEDPASLYIEPSSQPTSTAKTPEAADGENGLQSKKRKLDASVKVPVHFVCIELVATGFLRHMVRRIIGTARPIAEGTLPANRMKQVLDGEVEPGPSAPSKGLWLHRTWLTEADWDNDTTKDV